MGFQLWAPAQSISVTIGSTSPPSPAVNGTASAAVVSILVSKNAGRYRVQADSYPALYVVLAGEKLVEFLDLPIVVIFSEQQCLCEII